MSTALAGIGMTVNIRKFFEIGVKPLGLGAITWMVVIVMSLFMQQLLHIW